MSRGCKIGVNFKDLRDPEHFFSKNRILDAFSRSACVSISLRLSDTFNKKL